MYKLVTLCHRCLNGNAPPYLQDLLTLYVTPRSLRSSSDQTRLTLPRMQLKTFGERSFESWGLSCGISCPKKLLQWCQSLSSDHYYIEIVVIQRQKCSNTCSNSSRRAAGHCSRRRRYFTKIRWNVLESLLAMLAKGKWAVFWLGPRFS